MGHLKNIAIAIGASAALAFVFSYLVSTADDFILWFALLLACSIANGLTITPTRELPNTSAQEWRRPIFTGQTIHAPRFDRLKDPSVATLLVVLAGVLVLIWVRA